MYATGRLGEEPIRSQGHIHKISPLSLCSTPEIYEIWEGEGVIYMQEYGDDDPGRCFAVSAKAGEIVIVPPGWTHATISANPDVPLVFGAWCDREYGFVYDKVRAHKGVAWFPLFDDNGKLKWEPNPHYTQSELICKSPEQHPELGIVPGEAIYSTFEQNPDAFLYVPYPKRQENVWKNFIP
jgi:glucose-6-phosphate isomerase